MKRPWMLAVVALMLLSWSCTYLAAAPQPTVTPWPTVPDSTPTWFPPPDVTGLSELPPQGWISFLNGGNLWLVQTDGRDVRQITDFPPVPETAADAPQLRQVHWSRDGRLLGYSYGTAQAAQLYLYSPLTNETALLLDKAGGGFDWLHDRQEIIYDTAITNPELDSKQNDGIWILNLDDGRRRQVLATGNVSSTWSPWGPTMGATDEYFTTDMPPYLVDLRAVSFGDLPGQSGRTSHCAWVRGQVALACFTLPQQENDQSDSTLFVEDLHGKTLQAIPLPKRMGPYPKLSWSPDGKRVAIGYVDADGKDVTDLLTLETGDIIQSFASGEPGDWSEDGAWLLTVIAGANEGGAAPGSLILVVNAASGKSFPIADGKSPLWQPPGTGSEAPTVVPTAAPVPTETAAVDWVTPEETSRGTILHIQAPGQQYDLGPLERGVYAVGPNGLFFIYVTNSGPVYAARLGDKTLTSIGTVRDFLMIRWRQVPELRLEFFGDEPYRVQVQELSLHQDRTFNIPRRITRP